MILNPFLVTLGQLKCFSLSEYSLNCKKKSFIYILCYFNDIFYFSHVYVSYMVMCTQMLCPQRLKKVIGSYEA